MSYFNYEHVVLKDLARMINDLADERQTLHDKKKMGLISQKLEALFVEINELDKWLLGITDD